MADSPLRQPTDPAGAIQTQSKYATDITPCSRLFLSADIVDSTKLKDEHNAAKLFDRYHQCRKLIESLNQHRPCKSPAGCLDIDKIPLQDFFPDADISQLDWPAIIANQFIDFHAAFESACTQQHIHLPPDSLWKCLGDEIIYSINITSPLDAHKFCNSFLLALRTFDGRLVTTTPLRAGRKLRMKGTAWVANFPVRNRKIQLLENFIDYLGQDIDIGFRIAKFSTPMILCMSMDLAYLLGEADTINQLTGSIVGWEPLKGVWGNTPYPIVWTSIPRYQCHQADIDFPPWESENNKHVKEFKKCERFVSLNDLRDKIKPIIKDLGVQIGITEPYIFSGNIESLPSDQRQLVQLLNELEMAATNTNTEPEKIDEESQEALIPSFLQKK